MNTMNNTLAFVNSAVAYGTTNVTYAFNLALQQIGKLGKFSVKILSGAISSINLKTTIHFIEKNPATTTGAVVAVFAATIFAITLKKFSNANRSKNEKEETTRKKEVSKEIGKSQTEARRQSVNNTPDRLVLESLISTSDDNESKRSTPLSLELSPIPTTPANHSRTATDNSLSDLIMSLNINEESITSPLGLKLVRTEDESQNLDARTCSKPL